MSSQNIAPGAGWWGWKNGYYRDVGDRTQLFIDDFIVEEMEGLKRVLHSPVKHEGNPVLKAEQDWEKGTSCRSYGTLVFDEEEARFKMWYSLYSHDWTEAMLVYATSTDGLRWERPHLGLVEYRGSRDNSLVLGPARRPTAEEIAIDPTMAGAETTFEGSWVIKDPVESDPARRYKMLFRGPPKLACFMVNGAHSPDGLHWTCYDENPILPLRSDTANNVFWDPAIDRYVVFLRLFAAPDQSEPCTGHKNFGSIRIVGRSESRDFVHWSPPEIVMVPDAQDRETGGTLHDLQVLPYEGVYIGFLGVCHRYKVPRDASATAPEDRIEVHSGGDEAECEDVQLAFSRDGVRWIRAGNREPFLALSRPYEQTREWIQMFQPPLIVGDEVWFYYSAVESAFDPNPFPAQGRGDLPHGTMTGADIAIGLARLRLDGFVSLEPTGEEGVLSTKPFKFTGHQLAINADARGGAVTVEVLEYDNKYHHIDITPVPGFTRDDCHAFTGDAIRHPITWKGGSDLSALRGKTIELKFHVRRAKLYAFQFRGD